MSWDTDYQFDKLPAPRWWEVINPVWLASDMERNPAWPWWAWFKRNPFGNCTARVIGVAHHRRWWINTMGGRNFPVAGWGFGWVIADACWLPRPWICRRGRLLSLRLAKLGFVRIPCPTISDMEIGIGWKSHGGFGINIRRSNATNATQDPPQ